jgi:hypothetical protein
MYNDQNELVGIDKGICSHINITFEDSQIASATKFVAPSSDLYPDEELPPNARLLKDFNWRGNEKINSLEEIFSDEEIAHDKSVKQEREQKRIESETPMQIQPETLIVPEKEEEKDNQTPLPVKERVGIKEEKTNTQQ